METTNNENVYLIISFALGVFWGTVFLFANKDYAVIVGMFVAFASYYVLRLFGNSADA